jgi:RHS repeat-associated protein
VKDATGDTVQTYEYSVYGRVAAEDPNHPNPYMFTGRRFDAEIGLYYYRARYYDPFTGRFLQTDPVGYQAGMNVYRYCANNPVRLRDPFGLEPNDPCGLLRVLGSVLGLGSDVLEGLESVAGLSADVFEGLLSALGDAPDAAKEALRFILADIASHTEVAFYVIGPNGIRLPVKIFESRSVDSNIPFLAGIPMNLGGEIHIGPEMADDLISRDCGRDANGIDLEALGTPIKHKRGYPDPEGIMAHEIGHQVDADKFGPGLYQLIGLVLTQNQNSKFEENASQRGEYYGIDWNYNP